MRLLRVLQRVGLMSMIAGFMLVFGAASAYAAGSWTTVRSLPATAPVLSLYSLDDMHAWVRTTRGGYLTADGGATWETQTSDSLPPVMRGESAPSGYNLPWSVYFSDASNGYGVAEIHSDVGSVYGACFFRTTDGGRHWRLVSSLFPTDRGDELLSEGETIRFVDPLNGWVIGWDGLFVTSDGGLTWTLKSGATNGYLLDNGMGWSDAGWGPTYVSQTLDGGATWRQCMIAPPANHPYSFEPPVFVDSLRGIVVGSHYPMGRHTLIYRTVNGGVTWTPTTDWTYGAGPSLPFGEGRYADRPVRAGSVVWTRLVGCPTADGGEDGQRWIRSKDGGARWAAESFGYPDVHRTGIERVSFSDANNGWAVNSDGSVVLRTTTGGSPIPDNQQVGSVQASSRMSRVRTYTVYGDLKPRHPSGSKPVRIYKQRYRGGEWISAGYVTASVSDLNGYSRYSARVRLSTSGKWRLRAFAPADSGHYAQWSSSHRYVTVY